MRTRLLLYGVCAMALAALLALVTRRQPEQDDGYTTALIQAHTRNAMALRHERDSLRVVKARLDTVYVVQRRAAKDAVAALPVVGLSGDTLTLGLASYVIPAPVAAYVGQLQRVVAVQESALTAADSALLAHAHVLAVTDSVAVEQRAADSTRIAQLESRQPGALSRAWNVAKLPVGVALGWFLATHAPK